MNKVMNERTNESNGKTANIGIDTQAPTIPPIGPCPAEGPQQQAAPLQGLAPTWPQARPCSPTVMLKHGCSRESIWPLAARMVLQRYIHILKQFCKQNVYVFHVR